MPGDPDASFYQVFLSISDLELQRENHDRLFPLGEQVPK